MQNQHKSLSPQPDPDRSTPPSMQDVYNSIWFVIFFWHGSVSHNVTLFYASCALRADLFLTFKLDQVLWGSDRHLKNSVPNRMQN